MIRRIKLQIFFILIFIFNTIHSLFLPMVLKRVLYFVSGFKIGKKVSIQSVKFFQFGRLIIGENTIINSGVYLDNRRGISIGKSVVIAHDSKIYTLGHDINDLFFATKGKPVNIEDFVIIFSNVLVMPGVTIKKGAVILPGAVITKDVDSMSIMGGNPAKVVGQRKEVHSKKETIHYWLSL